METRSSIYFPQPPFFISKVINVKSFVLFCVILIWNFHFLNPLVPHRCCHCHIVLLITRYLVLSFLIAVVVSIFSDLLAYSQLPFIHFFVLTFSVCSVICLARNICKSDFKLFIWFLLHSSPFALPYYHIDRRGEWGSLSNFLPPSYICNRCVVLFARSQFLSLVCCSFQEAFFLTLISCSSW